MTHQSSEIAALEALVEDKLIDTMPATPRTLAAFVVETVLRELNGKTGSTSPQPIETAPKGDGWILGYAPDRAERCFMPWIAITWCDLGWMDHDGNTCSPTLWTPLPDPQPAPTGWRPVEGTVVVSEITGQGWADSKGNPIAVPYRWAISIERNDGSYDKYRDCYHEVTRADAERRGAAWGKKYGLPVRIIPLGPRLVFSGAPITEGGPA